MLLESCKIELGAAERRFRDEEGFEILNQGIDMRGGVCLIRLCGEGLPGFGIQWFWEGSQPEFLEGVALISADHEESFQINQFGIGSVFHCLENLLTGGPPQFAVLRMLKIEFEKTAEARGRLQRRVGLGQLAVLIV